MNRTIKQSINKEIEDLNRLITKPVSRTLSNNYPENIWLHRSDDRRNRRLKEIHNKRLKHLINKIPARQY